MAGYLPRLFSALLPKVRPYQGMGVSGTPVYAGYVLSPERSPKLIGQQKYRTYAEILANTSIVAAGTRYFLNIVAKPSWSFEPANDTPEAKQMAEFAEDVFDDLHTPWQRIVRRCGTYRFHGFSIQEWTAVKRDDGKIGFLDIEARPQWTIWRWEVDEQGKVTGAWQRDPLTGRELGLPRGKLMYIVDDTLTDSPEGMGILRHCVEPSERLAAYLKQEGFGFLRDLHGVPLGRAPMDELAAAVKAGNMSQAQMDQAIEKLKQFCALEAKTNDTAIVLNSQPYIDATDSGNTVSSTQKWDVELISGGAPGLQYVGEAIVRLNTEMARVLGVEHLLLGADAAGSYALAKEKATDLYLLANSVLADIAQQAEHDLLWPLWKLNGFKDELMPNMHHEDVQPKDAEQISRVLRDMATAGASLQPDDEVQNFVRDLLGAPKVDLAQLQERMNEEIQTQQEQMVPGGGGGGRNQRKQPTGYQEDTQDARDARAEKRLVTKAAFAKRLVDKLIVQSSNGSLPVLRKIRGELENILEKVNPNHDEHGRFSSGSGEKASDEQRSKLEELLDKAKKVHGSAQPVLGLIATAVKEHLLGTAVNAAISTLSGGGVDPEEASITKARLRHGIMVAEQLARKLRARILSSKEEDVAKAVQTDWNKEFATALEGLISEKEAEALLKALVDTIPAGAAQHLIDIVGQFDLSDMKKVVPYAEADPYRNEDEFIAGRSGAADGTIPSNGDFSVRRRLKNTGPNLNDADNSGDQLKLGEVGVPGAAMRVKGRRRTL